MNKISERVGVILGWLIISAIIVSIPAVGLTVYLALASRVGNVGAAALSIVASISYIIIFTSAITSLMRDIDRSRES